MKRSIYFLLSVCLAGFLFSCAANPAKTVIPEWVRKLPQPPKDANYDYQRGEGTAETRDKARKKAEEDALDKTFINGMNIRKTSRINHKFICNYIVEENCFKYKAYVLLIYERRFTGVEDDFKEGEGCESNEIIFENQNDENCAEKEKKIGELSQKTTSFGALAQKFESVNHPKEKNEIWHEFSRLYKEINELQTELKVLDVPIDVDSIADIFEKMHNSCLEYRQNTKIYWQPEQENEYSAMAFSILSKNLKMEKSACQSNGISLLYRYAEPDCSYKFGMYNCLYKPSLSLLSCDGTEYLLLESVLENSRQNQDLALEKIKDSFKAADFWKRWEREIEGWSLKCE